MTNTATTYVISTNGVEHETTYTNKARAIKEAQEIAIVASGMDGSHVIIVATRATGKIVFQHETKATVKAPEAVETTLSPAVDTVKLHAGNEMCGWCDKRAEYIITIPTMSHDEVACVEHFRGYFPYLANIQLQSALCPDVEKGCSHTMAQSEDGYGVACVEYADALGIAWMRVSRISLSKPTDTLNLSVAGSGATDAEQSALMTRTGVARYQRLAANDLSGLKSYFAGTSRAYRAQRAPGVAAAIFLSAVRIAHAIPDARSVTDSRR